MYEPHTITEYPHQLPSLSWAQSKPYHCLANSRYVQNYKNGSHAWTTVIGSCHANNYTFWTRCTAADAQHARLC
jgi:hypothetical protein